MLACGPYIVVAPEGASGAGGAKAALVLSERSAGDGLGLLLLPQIPISRCQDAYNTQVKTFESNS